MMSKKRWAVLFFIYVCYLLIGATVFFKIESKQEEIKNEQERKQKDLIEELLEKYYVDNQESGKSDIFNEISNYCNKPLGDYGPDMKMDLKWTFYHSAFYVLTIVSTIGYGNLSPTTPFTKTFMIIYGLIGIPINGIVSITLGNFFGKTFYNIYKKWKKLNVNNIYLTLGLVGKIVLYVSFGITFFIFVPAFIIILYEDWSFSMAIEFTFGTLTTIGAGSYIPGTQQNGYSLFVWTIYRIFLLSWILIGLGYVAMIFGFISRGLQSKRMVSLLEHKLANSIKKTNRKIRQELRSMLNEYLLTRIKPVYTKTPLPITLTKSKSCPNLTLYSVECDIIKWRRKAISAYCKPMGKEGLFKNRSDSDSNLNKINKEQTFKNHQESKEPNNFIFRVASALGNYDTVKDDNSNTSSNNNLELEDTFDEELFSRFKLNNRRTSAMRPRCSSESKKEKPTAILNMPWYTSSTTRRIVEQKEKQKYGKARSRTLPSLINPHTIFKKIKTTFVEEPKSDVENQIDKDGTESNKNTKTLLEETTLAELIRALTAIKLEDFTNQVKVSKKTSLPEVAHITTGLECKIRRTSVIPLSPTIIQDRKFSFR